MNTREEERKDNASPDTVLGRLQRELQARADLHYAGCVLTPGEHDDFDFWLEVANIFVAPTVPLTDAAHLNLFLRQLISTDSSAYRSLPAYRYTEDPHGFDYFHTIKSMSLGIIKVVETIGIQTTTGVRSYVAFDQDAFSRNSLNRPIGQFEEKKEDDRLIFIRLFPNKSLADKVYQYEKGRADGTRKSDDNLEGLKSSIPWEQTPEPRSAGRLHLK